MYKDRSTSFQGDIAPAQRYLLDLEVAGNVDGCLFVELGECYMEGVGRHRDQSTAVMYQQRAIDLEYPPASVKLSKRYWDGYRTVTNDEDKSIIAALKAEESGMARKDERILANLLWNLTSTRPYTPNAEILGAFKSKIEMILHFCDVLTQRGSSVGHTLKGFMYFWGDPGLQADEAKALSIWEEADTDSVGLASTAVYLLGFCHFYEYVINVTDNINISLYIIRCVSLCNYHNLSYLITYCCLSISILCCRRGIVVPVNGNKILEYCEKAIHIAKSDAEMVDILLRKLMFTSPLYRFSSIFKILNIFVKYIFYGDFSLYRLHDSYNTVY